MIQHDKSRRKLVLTQDVPISVLKQNCLVIPLDAGLS